jgi:hypothetical protein
VGGAGLICPALLVRGQVIEMSFQLTDPKLGPCVERVKARVVNFMADLDGNRVGVEFLEPLHDSRNPALARAVSQL